MQQGKQAAPPSSAARVTMFADEQEKRPIMNGRPFRCNGLPVHLFHPAFSTFVQNFNGRDRMTAAEYSTAYQFNVASSQLYDMESQRKAAIFESLHLAIHFHLVNVDGTTPRGRILADRGDGLPATIAICELRNEIGSGGCDPSIQGGLSYRKLWVADEVCRAVS